MEYKYVILRTWSLPDGVYVGIWWYGDMMVRKPVSFLAVRGPDGRVCDFVVKHARYALECAAFDREPLDGERDIFTEPFIDRILSYFVVESGESLRSAIEEALDDGVAKLRLGVKKVREPGEVARLSEELLERGLMEMERHSYIYRSGYPVDAYLPKHRMIVEVDGREDLEERMREKDPARLELLRRRGYEVLRVGAEEIRRDLDSVANTIGEACERRVLMPERWGELLFRCISYKFRDYRHRKRPVEVWSDGLAVGPAIAPLA